MRIAAVERHPGHELAVDERAATAPGLPDSLFGLAPVVAEPLDEGHDVPPAVVTRFPVGTEQAAVEGLQRVQRLTVDVELELMAAPFPIRTGHEPR